MGFFGPLLVTEARQLVMAHTGASRELTVYKISLNEPLLKELVIRPGDRSSVTGKNLKSQISLKEFTI